MAKPVSIIALCHNRWADARRCFESVRKNTPGHLYEVLAYDQASTDGTLEGLRRMAKDWPQLKVIENPRNFTFSQAVNRGMRAAKGRNILWLNNDTIVGKGWLQVLLKSLYVRKDIGAVGPMTDNMAPHRQVARRRFSNKRRGDLEETPFLGGFCFLMRREVLDQVGPLDERFVWGWEDMDYCLRVRQAGWRLAIARGIFVHHIGNRTISTMQREHRRQSDKANRALIRRKWLATTPWRGDLMDLLERFPDPPWEPRRPDGSIIMLCDGLDDTLASLKSVQRHTAGHALEVLAIPFNTTRKTHRSLKALSRDWSELSILGPWDGIPWTNAVNMALGRARGENMILLSPQARVSAGWLKGLMDSARSDTNIGLVGPGANDPGQGRRYRVHHLDGSCLLIPRRTLELQGFLDDRFAGPLGAMDYCLRVQQAGYQVIKDAAVRVETRTLPIGPEHPEDTRLFFTKWAGHPIAASLLPRPVVSAVEP